MNSHKVKIYWDFIHAEFIHKSAKPESSFYIAIIWNSQVEFFLNDLLGVAKKMSNFVNPTLLSRLEHVLKHQNYSINVQLLVSKHELVIECSIVIVGFGNGGWKVKVDGVVSLARRLAWKFRGNERIKDVFNCAGAGAGAGGVGINGDGNDVFVFEISRRRKSMSMSPPCTAVSPSSSCSSFYNGRTRSNENSSGFSLLLYARKCD
ncbi:hypothetical protein MKX01_003130 [Papaver californicum]|nr:hypothetical protein MKX01_003130 [Papaver californicum]